MSLLCRRHAPLKAISDRSLGKSSRSSSADVLVFLEGDDNCCLSVLLAADHNIRVLLLRVLNSVVAVAGS
jgi:hypothetical protein